MSAITDDRSTNRETIVLTSVRPWTYVFIYRLLYCIRSISKTMLEQSPYLWEPAKNARESTNGRQDPSHLRRCPSAVAWCCSKNNAQSLGLL